MTLLYILLAFAAGFVVASLHCRPRVLPCACKDESLRGIVRHPDEDAAGRVN